MFLNLFLNNFNRSYIGLRIDFIGFKIFLIYCSGICVFCEKVKFKFLFFIVVSRIVYIKFVFLSDFFLLLVVLKDVLDVLFINGKCIKKLVMVLVSFGNYK